MATNRPSEASSLYVHRKRRACCLAGPPAVEACLRASHFVVGRCWERRSAWWSKGRFVRDWWKCRRGDWALAFRRAYRGCGRRLERNRKGEAQEERAEPAKARRVGSINACRSARLIDALGLLMEGKRSCRLQGEESSRGGDMPFFSCAMDNSSWRYDDSTAVIK